MSSTPLRYVVCYDVTDDTRRRRLARVLEGYGDRVQYSVFEAVLDRKLTEDMIREIQECIAPEEDRVIVCALCASCDDRRVFLGRAESMEVPGDELVFIV